MKKILFVCMGNICRSPTACGVFEHIVKQQNKQDLFEIDSAGTHSYHTGSPPDSRAQKTMLKHGIDISRQRARIISNSDYYYYDYIIAMDNDNYSILTQQSPVKLSHKIHRLLDFLPKSLLTSVPDPYYHDNFDFVYKLIYQASNKLLIRIDSNA